MDTVAVNILEQGFSKSDILSFVLIVVSLCSLIFAWRMSSDSHKLAKYTLSMNRPDIKIRAFSSRADLYGKWGACLNYVLTNSSKKDLESFKLTILDKSESDPIDIQTQNINKTKSELVFESACFGTNDQIKIVLKYTLYKLDRNLSEDLSRRITIKYSCLHNEEKFKNITKTIDVDYTDEKKIGL